MCTREIWSSAIFSFGVDCSRYLCGGSGRVYVGLSGESRERRGVQERMRARGLRKPKLDGNFPSSFFVTILLNQKWGRDLSVSETNQK